MNWWPAIIDKEIEYAKDKPKYVNLLHAYFTAKPLEFARMSGTNLVELNVMFKDLDTIPLESYLKGLTPEKIKGLDLNDFKHICEHFITKNLSWENFSPTQQNAFVERFLLMKLPPATNDPDLLTRHVAINLCRHGRIEQLWIWYKYFKQYPEALKTVSQEQATKFVKDFFGFSFDVISLDGVQIDKALVDLFKAISEPTPNQIKWLEVLVPQDG